MNFNFFPAHSTTALALRLYNVEVKSIQPYTQQISPKSADITWFSNPGAKLVEGEPSINRSPCPGTLGFPEKKKWLILCVIFVVQISMNFNASVYGMAVDGMVEEYGISHQKARCGQMVFLIAYAFGCELWAPWSEEKGRWIVLRLSLFFVNVWQIPTIKTEFAFLKTSVEANTTALKDNTTSLRDVKNSLDTLNSSLTASRPPPAP
ncbi:hypothetical protein H2199_007722 [Coniosporium tulheliwenetii]|uniref:Uncharacterized protein n=1 Tax=Coniosporium tulheliwenetii TaxID=3383036 RepID=A0ACC2YNK8_9PEZI|nr:hypothetical protein H2199_007722 [Cladosporium sp. JES 115]